MTTNRSLTRDFCWTLAAAGLSGLGAPAYGAAVQKLIFGNGHTLVESRRAVTAHCPGGTGAIRVAIEMLKRVRPATRVWLSAPTWPNWEATFCQPQICWGIANTSGRVLRFAETRRSRLSFETTATFTTSSPDA